MLTAHYSSRFRQFYANLNWVVLPAQRSIDLPIRFIHEIRLWIGTKSHLIAKNNRLKIDVLQLRAQMQELLAFKKENAQFRQLFQSKLYVGGKLVVAQLLAINLNPTSQEAVLDKGEQQKVYVGQPVLDGYGIMGQVVDVAALTSKVLLITDPRFAIPVENYRTNMRAIAVGTGKLNELMLIHVVDAADIQLGDLFVSSGLALRFPMSYPVGVVTKLSHQVGDKFLSVTLKPTAHVMQSSQVLLNWPIQRNLQPAVKKQLQTPLMTM